MPTFPTSPMQKRILSELASGRKTGWDLCMTCTHKRVKWEKMNMRARRAGNLLCLPLIAGGILAILAVGATISSQEKDWERFEAQMQMAEIAGR